MSQVNMKDLTFGIEIECFYNYVGYRNRATQRSRKNAAEAVASVVGGSPYHYGGGYDEYRVEADDGRTWKVMSDSSVTGESCEVVSPICTYKDIETVQEICRALRAAGLKVDSSCGIHIHIGADVFNGKSLRNLVRMVNRRDELIGHALENRRRQGCWWDDDDGEGYARLLNPAIVRRVNRLGSNPTLDQMNRAWYGRRESYPSHYDGSRYNGLNLHNVWFRGTVEFRWFNGTLHAGKVKSYIQFVMALAAYSCNVSRVSGQKLNVTREHAKRDIWRWMELVLKLKGEEFATCRLHLTRHLNGNAPRTRRIRVAA